MQVNTVKSIDIKLLSVCVCVCVSVSVSVSSFLSVMQGFSMGGRRKLKFGGCLRGVKRVDGRCLEVVWEVSGRCLESLSMCQCLCLQKYERRN